MLFNKININNYNILKINNIHDYIEALIAKQHSCGFYFLQNLGLIIKKKIENELRRIFDDFAIEVLANSISCEQIYKKSKRETIFGSEIFKIIDRQEKLFLMNPTCEELFSSMFISNKRSYKTLPFCVYQISSKFRDEIRPKNSIVRSREFYMKDAYYFCRSEKEMYEFYNKIKNIYQEILKFFKIEYEIIKADGSSMLSDYSEEFIAKSKIEENHFDVNTSKQIKGIEIAHIFNLGTKYSKDNNYVYVSSQGNYEEIYMGSYGIGISRLIFLICEQIFYNNYKKFNIFDYCFIPRNENDFIHKYYENNKNNNLLNNNFEKKYFERIEESLLIGANILIIEENERYFRMDSYTKLKTLITENYL